MSKHKAEVSAPAHDFQDDVIAAHLRGVSGYTPDGLEIPSAKQVEVPVEFSRPVPLSDEVRRLLRMEEFNRAMDAAGLETFEEADDFDVPDDPVDPSSPYEEDFEPAAPGVAAREGEIRGQIVQDRPLSEKEAARDRLREVRKMGARGDAPRGKPGARDGASSGGAAPVGDRPVKPGDPPAEAGVKGD